MSSDSSLPLVTFGKYKGKPVTEMLADTKYVEWCKQQEFFKKHTTIYNICVNQTIGAQQTSKTPEHNRIQNLFLDDRRVATFMASLKTSDEDHKKYLVEQISKKKVWIEFEGKFNWDVIINKDTTTTISPSYKCTNSWEEINYGNRRYCKTAGKCLCIEWFGSIYIEIKPLLGDDYPTVLRKMNTQKELTKPRGDSVILLIKDYQSTTTTKEELVKIFSQSGILVVFLHDIFPDLPLSSPSPASTDEKIEPMLIQMATPVPVSASASSSSQDRIDLLEMRVARLEALLAKMGVQEE